MVTTSFSCTGNYTITAVYCGDTNFTASTSATITQTVCSASTTTITGASPNPSSYGQAITLTATVSPIISSGSSCCCCCGSSGGSSSVIPAGLVTFLNAATTLGVAVLNAGQAVLLTCTLVGAAGLDYITAIYSGNANVAGSTSAAWLQTVTRANTVTNLTAATSSSVFGQNVTFTATVSASRPGSGTATGLVTFRDSNTVLGFAPLVGNGLALFTTCSLSVTGSPYTITAVYGGNRNFAGSSSTTLTQTVTQDSTTATLTCAGYSSGSSQQVTFTATVAAGSPGSGLPTGTVTFQDGGTPLGTALLLAPGPRTTLATLATTGQLPPAIAILTTSSSNITSTSFTAVYVGDTNFTGSTATQTLGLSTTTLAASPNPSVFGQTVTFTATVSCSSGTPTGLVTFQDVLGTLAIIQLNSTTGTATCSTSILGLRHRS